MASITIRNLDDALKDRLRVRAARRGLREGQGKIPHGCVGLRVPIIPGSALLDRLDSLPGRWEPREIHDVA